MSESKSSLLDLGTFGPHVFECKLCETNKIADCLGDCPNCGRFVYHDEKHTDECTLEEDYETLATCND